MYNYLILNLRKVYYLYACYMNISSLNNPIQIRATNEAYRLVINIMCSI